MPHVHVHIIPRQKGDMDSRGGGDRLYEMMDGEEGNVGGQMWDMFKMMQERRGQKPGPDGDATRMLRSEEEMSREAEWLRKEMTRDEAADEQQESTKDPRTTS